VTPHLFIILHEVYDDICLRSASTKDKTKHKYREILTESYESLSLLMPISIQSTFASRSQRR